MTLNEAKQNMEKALKHLQEGLSKIRTGRAHPGIVEDLKVEAYGSTQSLKGLAGISTPSPREILISPWDKGVMGDIEKAIKASELSLSPTIAGDQIKLSLPELTAERREELVKLVNSQAEEIRISLRNVREDYLQSVKKEVEDKTASEDDLEKAKKDVQKEIDTMNEKLDELVQKKIKEIKTV